MKEQREEIGINNLLKRKVVGNRTRWTEDVSRVAKTHRQDEHQKQKTLANNEEAETKTEMARQHKTRPGES